MGPFFARLAEFLRARGSFVRKVNFNGGDWFYYPFGADAYTGRHEDLDDWLEHYFRRHQFDAVVIFGQSRPVHAVARNVAARLGIKVYVFEEGYIRPDYVTLEEGGVNAYSRVPRDSAAYDDLPSAPVRTPQPTDQSFWRMAVYAMGYSFWFWALQGLFRHHRYHRPLNPWVEAACWVRGGVRKLVYLRRQSGLLPVLTSPERSHRWYLLPLQVHNDSQISHHSAFDCMEEVIRRVMTSFARNAPADHWLVIKHHPMDRAYRDYSGCIRACAKELGLGERVLYVHDLHLPTLLKHTRGVVTVNSTTGLQALYHRVPVKTLGDCFYDVPGLVHQGELDGFWKNPGPVDVDLYRRFREYLIRHTQLNISFYGKTPAFEQPLPRLVMQPELDVDTLESQPVAAEVPHLPLRAACSYEIGVRDESGEAEPAASARSRPS